MEIVKNRWVFDVLKKERPRQLSVGESSSLSLGLLIQRVL